MGAGASAQGAEADTNCVVEKDFNVKTIESVGIITDGSHVRLRVAHEALAIVSADGLNPIIFYPYHTIMCWGHSPKTFQFRVFHKNKTPDTLKFSTTQGKELEDLILRTVKSLMTDIEHSAVSDQEFRSFLSSIQTEIDPTTKLATIDQFIQSHTFIARHGVELLRQVEGDTFDQIEVAILMYDRIINKESFQLLLNEFKSKEDRENVCHRLKIPVTSPTKNGKSPNSKKAPNSKNSKQDEHQPTFSLECPDGLNNVPKHATYDATVHAETVDLDEAEKKYKAFVEEMTRAKMTIHQVRFQKRSSGIGLSLEGVKIRGMRLVAIEAFVKDLPAFDVHERGELQISDVILRIGSKPVVDVNLAYATNCFKQLDEQVSLEVARATIL